MYNWMSSDKMYIYITHTTIKIEEIPHAPFQSIPPHLTSNYCSDSITTDSLACSWTSYKWHHLAWTILCLASFIQHVFKIMDAICSHMRVCPLLGSTPLYEFQIPLPSLVLFSLSTWRSFPLTRDRISDDMLQYNLYFQSSTHLGIWWVISVWKINVLRVWKNILNYFSDDFLSSIFYVLFWNNSYL